MPTRLHIPKPRLGDIDSGHQDAQRTAWAVKYVLDTNAVSALMRGEVGVVRTLKSKNKQDVVVPQPVLAEIAYGIERLPRSHRKERLRERFSMIREEIPRVAWDDQVSDRFGTAKAALERAGARLEDFDLAVAAHALAILCHGRDPVERIASPVATDPDGSRRLA